MELSDIEFEEIIQDGHTKEKFIERVIDQYSQAIIWLSYTYVKDRQIAEEVTQDVFLTCFHKIDTFRQDASIKTWLYRIAVNKCKDRLRRRKLKDLLLFNPGRSEEVAIEKDHPESITFSQLKDQELSERVLSLPTKFKEVIFMHYFEDMKLNQISDVLEVKQNTVKTRLNRGRNMLKEMYEKEGEI